MMIWFDMDGTIANLYGVENWLPMLRAYDPTPYANAVPLLRLSRLAYMIHKAQANGHEVGIISWLSKCSNNEYDAAVTSAKYEWLRKHLPSVEFDEIYEWLRKHLPSVEFDEIHIVPYGLPKQNFKRSEDDILFDDEERNRTNWGDNAYTEKEIFEVLKSLA